jgi:putative component of toxin-antitoxin plasmid stabilization module
LSYSQIEHYARSDGHVPYEDFFRSLKDIEAKVIIGKVGLSVVLLLCCGGPKKTQVKDIPQAIAYLAEYKKRKKEGKDADKKT